MNLLYILQICNTYIQYIYMYRLYCITSYSSTTLHVGIPLCGSSRNRPQKRMISGRGRITRSPEIWPPTILHAEFNDKDNFIESFTLCWFFIWVTIIMWITHFKLRKFNPSFFVVSSQNGRSKNGRVPKLQGVDQSGNLFVWNGFDYWFAPRPPLAPLPRRGNIHL